MQRILTLCLFFSIIAISRPLLAQDEGGSSAFKFAPSADVIFPIFVGAKGNLIVHDNFEFGIGVGIVPEPFYNVIGQVSASLGENDSYDDVINAAFANNQMLRFNFQYNFSGLSGWRVGLAGSTLDSSGEAEIDTVLGAATGRDYTNLKNFLVLAGRDTSVDMTGTLQILEIYGGYVWNWIPNLFIEVSAGVGKVMAADLHLKTGLPNFEASVAGSSLLRSSESDLETIVIDNGISPTVGLTLKYQF